MTRSSTQTLLAAVFWVMQSSVCFTAIMDGDQRMAPSAYWTEAEQGKYSGVGRVECPVPGEPEGSMSKFIASGFISQSTDTVVTVSHAFYQRKNPPKIMKEIRSDPISCHFVTFDRFGNIRDRVGIYFAKIYWDELALHSERSFDLAIVKLKRPPNHAVYGYALGNGKKLDGKSITLVSFSNDVEDMRRPRKSSGLIYPMPLKGIYDNMKDSRLSDNKRMCATSVDSSHGSSGAPYIDDRNFVVGIHVGSITEDGKGMPGDFDLEGPHYNYCVYVDRAFAEDVKSIAKIVL